MNHYVLIDGSLQRSNPEEDAEEKPDTSVDLTDRRSDYQKIQDLEEIE